MRAAYGTVTNSPLLSSAQRTSWYASVAASRRRAGGAAAMLSRTSRRRVADSFGAGGRERVARASLRILTVSLRFGLETGVVAVLTTLVAVAVVYGVEAVHWYHIAPDVSVLDGDHVDLDSPRAAVLDVLNPILLLVHLVFWSPWPVLGALVGAQRVRRAPQAATG